MGHFRTFIFSDHHPPISKFYCMIAISGFKQLCNISLFLSLKTSRNNPKQKAYLIHNLSINEMCHIQNKTVSTLNVIKIKFILNNIPSNRIITSVVHKLSTKYITAQPRNKMTKFCFSTVKMAPGVCKIRLIITVMPQPVIYFAVSINASRKTVMINRRTG